MVFAHLGAFFIDKFLGNYIEDIDSHQLKISLWNGDITLNNVYLKTSALKDLNLPFDIETGYLEKLKIHLPWKHLYVQPTKIEIEGLYILLSRKTDVNYDPEKEEKDEYEKKMKQVEKVEQFRFEKEQYENDAKSAHHKDTFVERLQFHILRNLEVEINHIHIAYDDKTTKSYPFQFGITLDYLRFSTTNDQFENLELKEDSNLIYKFGEINNLSIYWNSNIQSRLDLSKEQIINDLKSDNHLQFPQMNYILQPLNVQTKLKIGKTSEEENFEAKILDGDIQFNNIYLNINKNQYADLLDFLEYEDYLNIKSKHRKYYQMIDDDVQSDKIAVKRWKFAYTSIVHENVRPRLISFKWENMKENLQRYKEYSEIYYNHLNHQNNKQRQQELEKQIDVFNLIYIRRTAQIQYTKKKVEDKSISWWEKFNSWWNSDSDKKDSEFHFNESLSNDEKSKLYKAIGYNDQSDKQISYPNDYIDINVSIRFNLTELNVWSLMNKDDVDFKIISSISIPQSQLQYQRRPAKDDFLFMIDCETIEMYGIDEDKNNKTSRPILIQQFNKSQENLLHFEFETNPINTKVDYRILAYSQSLQINYHAMTINKLFECFLPDKHHDLEGIKQAAYSIYTDIKHRTQFLLSENLKKIQDLDILIHIQSIYFILPDYGTLNESSSMICLDFGHLSFKGGKKNLLKIQQDVFHDAQSSVDETNDSLFVPIEIQLKQFQLLYLNQNESWKDLIFKQESPSHLIQPISITLNILKSINVQNTNIPIWKADGEMKLIECHLSDTRLFQFLKLIQTIPYPQSFQNNQQQQQQQQDQKTLSKDKKKTIPSTKETYETIEKMTPIQNILREEEQNLDLNKLNNQQQITQLQFNFFISKINIKFQRALLDLSDYCEEFLEISFELIQCSSNIKTYDIDLNISLDNFFIIHQQFLTNNNNEKLNLLNRQNKNSKLFQMNCLLTSDTNPLFSSSPYNSIENNIQLTLNQIFIYFHLQAFQSIISFTNNIKQKLAQLPKQNQIQSSSSSSSSSESSSSTSSSSSFKIDFTIEGFNLLIGNERVHMLYIELKQFQGYLSQTNLKMCLHFLLNDIRLIDLYVKSRYQYLISKENSSNDLIQFDLCLLNHENKFINKKTKSKENKSFLKGKFEKLNFIYLNKHIQFILLLINSFQTKQQKPKEIKHEEEEQSNSFAKMLQNYQKHSIEFHLDFILNLPQILLPINSYSNKAISIDLGNLQMHTDSNEKFNEQHRITFDNIISNRVILNENNEIIEKNSLFQCSPFLTLINRYFNSNKNHIEIKIQWDTIQFKFSKDDYAFIDQILKQNFKEKTFHQFTQIENIQTDEDQHQNQSQIQPKQIKSNKDLSKKKDESFEIIQFQFQIKQITFELYQQDENSKLLNLIIKSIESNFKYFSDSTLNGIFQIQQIYLDDLRNKQISRLIDKHFNVKENNPIFNIQIQFKQFNRQINGKMESFYICLSPDLFNSIKDFIDYDISFIEKTKNKTFNKHSLQLNLPLPSKSISIYQQQQPSNDQSNTKTNNYVPPAKDSKSNDIETRLEFILNPSQIVLLEDQNKENSDCLALNLTLSIDLINLGDETKISSSIKDLSFFGTNYQQLKESQIRYSVLSPSEIDAMIIINKNEQKIDLNIGDISINIDPALIRTFVNLQNSINKKQENPKDEKEKVNSKTIFIPKQFKDSSFWFIKDFEEKDELLDEIDILELTTGSPSEKTNEIKEKEKDKNIEKYQNYSQQLIVNLNIIEVKIELGKGSSTRPVIAVCLSDIYANIENWSSDIIVSSSIQFELALFNDHILSWEPLIEPIIDDKGTVQSPWTILCETLQDQKEDNDEESRYLLTDDKKSESKEKSEGGSGISLDMKKVICIRGEHLLNLTLTKTTLDLCQRLSTMFNEIYKQGLPSDIDEEQSMLSIHNQTGFDIIISNIHGIEFPDDNKSEEKTLNLKSNEIIHLTVPEERLTATHLPAIVEQVAKRKQQFQVQIGENNVLVDINQTWRRVYELSSSLVPAWPVQLLCDSQVFEERRRVILSSIIKVSNRTTMPLILLDADSIEKNQFNSIAKIDVNQEFYLPIQLLYLRVTPRLYFAVHQENSNEKINDFISFDWANESSSDRILKLNDGRQAHYVVYKEEIEAYSENTDEPIRKSFNIYVKLALHLINLLPIPIQCSIDNVENVELKSSELYHSIQGNKKSILIFTIPSYNNSSWISEPIDLNEKGHGIHNEHIVKFNDKITGETLRMVLRVDTYRQSYRASFYSPFWIINSTDLKFEFKIENEKTFIDTINQSYYICPKNFNSESHKKKGHIRLFSVEQDENISQWSESFSLDVIKSTGMTSCKVHNDRTYLVCIDIVTSSFGMTKIITLAPSTAIVNNSSSDIEVTENKLENDEQSWKVVKANEIISFWPRYIEEGVMCVRYNNVKEKSTRFSMTDKHRTLLRMNDEQRPALHVEVTATDFDGYRIIFGDYKTGDAPILIVNSLINQSITFAQKDHLQTQMLPSQYYLYYTWDDPLKPRELIILSNQQSTSIQLNPVCGVIDKDSEDCVYYAIFHDGPQTVLFFSSDQSIIESVSDMPSLIESMKEYIQIGIRSVGISIVDDINRADLFYITINQSDEIWTEKRKFNIQPLSSKINQDLEQHYKTFLKHKQENKFEIDQNRYVSFNDDIAEISDNEGHIVHVKRQPLDGLWIGYTWSTKNMAIHCRINHIQIDNQLQITMFPTILYPIVSKSAGTDSPGKPFIELSLFKSSSTRSNTIFIKYLKLLIQEFAFCADQGLILALFAFIKQDKNPAAPTVNMESDFKRLSNPLETIVNEGTDNTSSETKIYFDNLHLSPLKIHVSFSMHGSKPSEQLLAEYPLADFLLQMLSLAEVQDVILKLNYYERKNDRYSITKLTKEISDHYTNQFLKQLHVVVLGLDVLGNPFGVIRGVAEGVESFFYEPYKGAMEGPIEFLEGIATGTKYFVGSVVGGAAGALSKVTQATSKGLATLTLDKDYQNARIQRKEIQAETTPEIVSSGKNALKDILQGVKGVVKKPIKGAKKKGAQGFFKGLGKGFLGLAGRPASGVADLTSTSFKLIRKVAIHEDVIHRIRTPRHVGRDGIVRPSIAHETLGHFIFDNFDESLHGHNEGYIAHINSSSDPSSLLFATTKQAVYLIEDSSSSGVYKVEWTLHYKNIKGTPTVKFEPNFIEFVLKETNAIGMTIKDLVHAKIVPYENIGEARYIVDKMVETMNALEL
ncbi:unnamed protein product [Adineta steineri]|uniref:Vacuolar protein sorting-associated protein n=1 Tax=Adineta steineri TaxID=433720 RepID=A0A813ZNK0_9BILA|nr:unnamed protein product [Adineta steineri]